MSPKPLLPSQPVTSDGKTGSLELVEIIQRLVDDARSARSALAAVTARLDAIAAVTAPTGGGTVDTQARTAIAAIIAAA